MCRGRPSSLLVCVYVCVCFRLLLCIGEGRGIRDNSSLLKINIPLKINIIKHLDRSECGGPKAEGDPLHQSAGGSAGSSACAG